MKRTCSYRPHLLYRILLAALVSQGCIVESYAQDRFLSEAWPLPAEASRMDPVFQSAKNIAVLARIPGAAAGIRSINVNGMRLLMTTTDAKEGFRFFSLDSMNTITPFGLIKLDPAHFVRDVETIVYPGGMTKLFLAVGEENSSAHLYGIILTDHNLDLIRPGNHFLNDLDSLQGINLFPISNLEMLYRQEDRLFVAGNTDTLKYFDISNPDTMVAYQTAIDPPTPLPTHQGSFLKIHEVKGATLADGKRLIGLGIPRGGMAILEFDTDWSLLSTRYQLYDGARTLFPSTVLNPHKAYYDSAYNPDRNRAINDKWDHRGCHSVIPYDQGGGRYVLTVDELNWFDGIQNKSGMWVPAWWERLDFFLSPDGVDFPNYSSCNDTGWYNHQPVYIYGALYRICSECSLREPESHRLNFIHRNYPGRLSTDPNKFQGSFIRIWNRDSLWQNDTATANSHGLIVGAYDAQEEPDNPVGYFGKDNIPDTSFVPSSMHEPILAGRRLYLAGYNSGARVLDVNGAQLRLRGYCRTEEYLSNDTNDVNFYARPDIWMYAKGIYRLIPDLTNDDVLFGSDIYNGT
jgi:hypothetical protein